jgi:hypothetical protein
VECFSLLIRWLISHSRLALLVGTFLTQDVLNVGRAHNTDMNIINVYAHAWITYLRGYSYRKVEVGALRLANPVLLHCLDLLWPIQFLQAFQKCLRENKL